MKKILLSPFLFLLFFVQAKSQEKNFYLPSGISDSQISLVKTYTLKALNTSLQAYAKVKERKLYKALAYIESALFFLNEASIFSPSYSLKKKIETLIKRINNFPDKYYKEDLISLKFDIQNLIASIIVAENILDKLNKFIENYDTSKNKEIANYLNELKTNISMPSIDEPLYNAKMFLAIAYDNLKAKNRKKVLKAIEIALDPMVKIGFKENLLLIRFKNSIYASYLAYENKNLELAKAYLQQSKKYLKDAYIVSSSENKDMIKGFLNQLSFIAKNFDSKEIVLREYIIIIRQIRNL